MKVKANVASVFFGLLVALACSDSPEAPELTEAEQLALDIEIIDQYLAERNIVAQKDDSGLRYVIHVEGPGPKPTLNSCIRTSYVGYLLSDGSVFDENTSLKRWLGVFISGWQIGFQKIPKGSKATLYIPSGLAYGKRGAGGDIPPNAILYFDVELFDVTAYNATGSYCN
jgi:FKBP-type peptidyl-prolyl cis-trans isomerase